MARLGGDEFLVLLVLDEEISDEKLGERLYNKLEQFNSKPQGVYSLSFSIGTLIFRDSRQLNCPSRSKNVLTEKRKKNAKKQLKV